MDQAESAVSLDEARDQLQISAAQSDGDTAELQRFIRAASRCAERYLHRVLAPRDITEVHDVGPRDPVVFLRKRPVISVYSVVVDAGLPSQTSVTGARLRGDVGQLRVPAAAGRELTVLFRAGMEPVPEDFKTGVKMIVAHLWDTQRPQARSRGYGSDDVDVQMVAGYAVPRAALEMLGPRGVT